MQQCGESGDLKVKCHKFEIQLVVAEARMRHVGDGNAGTSAIMVKPPKFDRSITWTVFHQQFEAVADHSSQEALEKAMHLLTFCRDKLQTSYTSQTEHMMILLGP
jgi:hypothetical protein